MKYSMVILALVGFSSAAMAQQGTIKTQVEQPPAERYTYATHLDIAKVISVDPIPDVCDVVPMHMTYQDTQGKQHILEYKVMGNGCSNG